MKRGLVLLSCLGALAYGQNSTNNIGRPQAGVVIEHFTLTGGRAYDGIWDAAKSEIHIVSKTNHVANLAVQPSEILARRTVGDGSKVKLYSDVEIAEKVLLLNQQNYTASKARLAAAEQRRDALHQTYAHKNLPQASYNAVMAQYKAADDAIANAQHAVEAARAGFSKAQEAYTKAGGTKPYSLPP